MYDSHWAGQGGLRFPPEDSHTRFKSISPLYVHSLQQPPTTSLNYMESENIIDKIRSSLESEFSNLDTTPTNCMNWKKSLDELKSECSRMTFDQICQYQGMVMLSRFGKDEPNYILNDGDEIRWKNHKIALDLARINSTGLLCTTNSQSSECQGRHAIVNVFESIGEKCFPHVNIEGVYLHDYKDILNRIKLYKAASYQRKDISPLYKEQEYEIYANRTPNTFCKCNFSDPTKLKYWICCRENGRFLEFRRWHFLSQTPTIPFFEGICSNEVATKLSQELKDKYGFHLRFICDCEDTDHGCKLEPIFEGKEEDKEILTRHFDNADLDVDPTNGCADPKKKKNKKMRLNREIKYLKNMDFVMGLRYCPMIPENLEHLKESIKKEKKYMKILVFNPKNSRENGNQLFRDVLNVLKKIKKDKSSDDDDDDVLLTQEDEPVELNEREDIVKFRFGNSEARHCSYCMSFETIEQRGKKKKAGYKICSRCKICSYCSRECQVEDWMSGHKFVCKK